MLTSSIISSIGRQYASQSLFGSSWRAYTKFAVQKQPISFGKRILPGVLLSIFGAVTSQLAYATYLEYTEEDTHQEGESHRSLLQSAYNAHEKLRERGRALLKYITLPSLFNAGKTAIQSIKFQENKEWSPIWRPPVRETPEQEHIRLLKEEMERIARGRAYPFTNYADMHESNVHDGWIDKRLADYLIGEEIFLPDMGEPVPDYAATSPYNAKNKRPKQEFGYPL